MVIFKKAINQENTLNYLKITLKKKNSNDNFLES